MIANAILKLGDVPPRERPAEQPPQPRVAWRIHVEHHLPDITKCLRRRWVTICVAPSDDENCCGLPSTDSTSACRSTIQNPGPSG
jgi:hypothetical protein